MGKDIEFVITFSKNKVLEVKTNRDTSKESDNDIELENILLEFQKKLQSRDEHNLLNFKIEGDTFMLAVER